MLTHIFIASFTLNPPASAAIIAVAIVAGWLISRSQS